MPVFSVAVALIAGAAAEVPQEDLAKFQQGIADRRLAAEDVRELCSVAPARLAGSAAHERALAWAEAKLRAVPGARVWRQEMTVPNWRRGRPTVARMEDGPDRGPLALAALGYSGATPKEGLSAPVLMVTSLAELEKLGRGAVEGKIVFFNRPMELDAEGRGSGYSGAVDQRSRGPALAARLGARAALVRSITQADNDHPHTGMTRFAVGQPPLPCAALGVKSAERLGRALVAAPALRLHLEIDASTGAPVNSANLIAEIRGSAAPGSILLVGGHSDSWDLSPGAHDNATGVAQSIEVFRLLARPPGPRHTLRCVLFTAEEIGLLGGGEYGRRAAQAGERYMLAVETDAGGFAPTGFDFDPAADPAIAARVERAWGRYLAPYGISRLTALSEGNDVRALVRQGGATAQLITKWPPYFLLHHSADDTPDKVDPADLQRGAAAIATLMHLADVNGMP